MIQTKPQITPQILERIQELTLYDDRFMSVALGQSIPCTECVLQIIYGDPSLTIVRVQAQKHVLNLERRDTKGHNAILDIFATDTKGKTYNLEIQVKPNDNLLRRARYYSAITDTENLREGADYLKLPEMFVVFVTQTDYFEQNKPIYAFETRCEDLPKSIHTGVHITFVNGEKIDDSALGKLMHDMGCADPDKMYYKELRERCAFLKRTPQGRLMMTGIWAEAIEQGIEIGKEQGIEIGKEQGIEQGENNVVLRLIRESGLSNETIVQYTGFTPEAVEKLRKEIEAESNDK